ncbi:MAG: type III secretion system inner membrane ring lipoprotein SctJ [Wenzhouxiangella sp.]
METNVPQQGFAKPGLTRVVMLLICATALLLTGCSEEALYNDLSERQANEMQAVLLQHSIEARKRRGDDGASWQLRVTRSDLPRALDVLNARGMPRMEYRNMGEMFERRGFVSSPLEERARFQHAVSQQLSNTFSRIDGVVEAHVHIALPERDRLATSPRESSASVVLIVEPDFRYEEVETRIRAIVTDAVEDLDNANRVTVVSFTRRMPPREAGSQDQTILAGQTQHQFNPLTLALLGAQMLLILVLLGLFLRRSRRANDGA